MFARRTIYSFQRTTKVSCYTEIFTRRGKTKVSYYIILREKQKYHITLRSSKLSWERFLATLLFWQKNHFILLREKESKLLCLQEEQYIPFNEQQVSCYKYLHCRVKTKVSYYILLQEKQKYHITSRSSKLSWKRFLAAFVILMEESFYHIARKEK